MVVRRRPAGADVGPSLDFSPLFCISALHLCPSSLPFISVLFELWIDKDDINELWVSSLSDNNIGDVLIDASIIARYWHSSSVAQCPPSG